MTVIKKNKRFKFQDAPQNEIEYRKLAQDLLEWSGKEESLTINEFPIAMMIPPTIFHTLPSHSEHFAQAYDIALHTIGARRERLARQGIIDKQIVLQTMPLYDSHYQKWILSTKNKPENNEQQKCIVVEIPSFNMPDTEPSNSQEK